VTNRPQKKRGGATPPRISPPDLPRSLLALAADDGWLTDEEAHSLGRLTNLDITERPGPALLLSTMEFADCKFSSTKFPEIRALDVRWNTCDLANARWEKATFARVEFLSCRLTGFTAPECDVSDIVFRDCQADLAKFRFSSFKSVKFEHCTLRESDFYGSDLSGVIFDDCDLTGAQMSEAKLAGAVLCGSNVEGLNVGHKELQGAIVDPTQAALLAGQLGLQVRWAEG
jgi:uncharacterized protein YjbI with pentapeptide repeats